MHLNAVKEEEGYQTNDLYITVYFKQTCLNFADSLTVIWLETLNDP